MGLRDRTGRASAGSSELLAAIERAIGVTPSGVAAGGLVVAGWALARVVGSRGMFLLVYGVLVVLGVSWLLGRRSLSVDAYRSELQRRVRVGQVVDVELAMQAKRRVSTIVLEEELPPPLGLPVRVPVPLLPAGEEVRHRYSFSPTLRGRYKVGPLVAEWTDPFGLTKRRVTISEALEIIVHPSTELAHDRVTSREWEDPPVRPPISKPWPSGFEFYGMREYVPGDDPRRIVWRAVAQYDKYLVREAEQGITDRVNIYLDTDSEWHSPGHPSDSFELAVRAAASLCSKHLKDGFSISLDVNERRVLNTVRGRRHEFTILDELAVAELGKERLTAALERMLGDRYRNAHNVVVTPYVTREAALRVRLLMQRGTSFQIVLVVGEDPDPALMHRVGSLGCPVVELTPNAAFDRAFQRAVGMTRR